MIIKTIPISQINPAPYNPRKDLKPSDPEYLKLAKSMKEFDLVEPLVWNKKSGNLVGGHQRLKILKDIGQTEVEVSVVDLSPVKEKALNLALNKISGEWDYPRLKDLLEELNTGEFDIEVTGFDDREIEQLMTQYHIPEEEWQGMPEFNQKDISGYKKVIIHFQNEHDFNNFCKLTGVKVRNSSCWYPPIENERQNNKRYESGES